MSNFTRSAYHPKEHVIRAANWLDDHFSKHEYGVSFPGDPHVYTTQEVTIPLDVVFVPAGSRIVVEGKEVEVLKATEAA